MHTANRENRFEVYSSEHVNNEYHKIMKDRETGVLYYYIESGSINGCKALTPLLDENGSVIVEK